MSKRRQQGPADPRLGGLPRGAAPQGTVIDPRPRVLIAIAGEPKPIVMDVMAKVNSNKRTRSHMTVPGGDASEVWNAAVQTVLTGDADYLMCVDETVIPQQNPIDLIQLDKDVIGMPSPLAIFGPKGSAYCYQGFRQTDDGYTPVDNAEGLMRVDAIGGGILIIARRVLETLHQTELGDGYPGPHGQFTPFYNKTGLVRESAMVAFCMRAAAMGFSTHCHYGYPCEQFQLLPVGAIMRDLAKAGGGLGRCGNCKKAAAIVRYDNFGLCKDCVETCSHVAEWIKRKNAEPTEPPADPEPESNDVGKVVVCSKPGCGNAVAIGNVCACGTRCEFGLAEPETQNEAEPSPIILKA